MGVEREYVERLKNIGGKGKGTAVKNLDHGPQAVRLTTDHPWYMLTLHFSDFL